MMGADANANDVRRRHRKARTPSMTANDNMMGAAHADANVGRPRHGRALTPSMAANANEGRGRQ
jgi:hypothetical protein